MALARDISWPVRPKPRDGEVLSSWLARIAEGHGLSLRDFRRARLPRTPGYGIDFDLAPDPGFFDAISHGALLPVEDVRRMGYAADEGLVYSRVAGTNPEWIVPLSPNHHTSVPFCPSCLATDAIPYYRKHWRYAFAPICPDHGLLTNNCPSCGAPYAGPSAGGPASGLGSCGRCFHCLQRFRPATIKGLEDHHLAAIRAAQDQILAGLNGGWVPVEGEPLVHICMYLRGLHDLVVLLLNAEHGPRVSSWISQESGLPSPCRTLGSLESQSSIVRATALAQAAWLVGEWPHRLALMVSALDLTWSAIGYKKTAPSWLFHPNIDQELGARRSCRSEEEIVAARNVLRRKRSWAPNEAELGQFMRTGEVPPIRPLSRPVPEYLKDFFDETNEIVDKVLRQRAASREAARAKARDIDSAIGRDPLASGPFEDLDDATERLTALSELRRKNRGKPTSG